MNHVEGENKGDIRLFAISTCPHCGRTKQFLNQLGVAYDFVDMDLLEKDERKQIEQTVEECNPRKSYPTLIINDECIIGLKKDEIKKELDM